MSMLASPDGHFAKAPDGELSISFPTDKVAPEAIEQFQAEPRQAGQDYLLIGRSSLAMAMAMGISQDPRPGMVEAGRLYVPAGIQVASDVGEVQAEIISEKLVEASEGEVLTWGSGQPVAGGRIFEFGALELMYADELQAKLDMHLIDCEDAYEDGRPTHRLLEDALAAPVAPWELELRPDHRLAQPDSLVSFLSQGREFALSNIQATPRSPKHRFASWTVGTVLFSPGAYYGQVVGVRTKSGFLPQDEGAAWLDPYRWNGHDETRPPERRGRQFEVSKEDSKEHIWDGAEALIRVYKPAAHQVAARHSHKWEQLTPTERKRLHRIGSQAAIQSLELSAVKAEAV